MPLKPRVPRLRRRPRRAKVASGEPQKFELPSTLGAQEPALSRSNGLASETSLSEPSKRPAQHTNPEPGHPGSLETASGTRRQPETPATTASHDIAALQAAAVAALAATKGQSSASEQLEDATWTLNGNTVEIQTTLSKTMLPVVINTEADRILKTTLRNSGAAQLEVKLLPGAPAANGAAKPKTPRAAAAGSAAELAEKHPLVQEAKRLFSAEISNVIDLRDKE